jgi:hypothetical protein
MHVKQVLILKRLEKKNGLRFADLSRGFDIDAKFPYHLKQLLNYSYIYKDSGLYFISKEGLKTSITYSSLTLEPIGHKVSFTGIVCDTNDICLVRCKEFNGERHYMLPRMKVLFGEKIEETTRKLIQKVIGSDSATFKAVSTHYRHLHTSDGDLLFDSVTTYFKVDMGVLDDHINLNAECQFMNIDQIASLPNKWPEIDLVLAETPNVFEEYDFKCDYNIQE